MQIPRNKIIPKNWFPTRQPGVFTSSFIPNAT